MDIRTLVLLVFTIALAFCWPAQAGEPLRYSGFIDNYPAMQVDPDGSGALLYRKPGLDLSRYRQVMLEPIEVWMADGSSYKGIPADELNEIAQTLHRQLVASLEPDYPVVSQPGAGVLRVRLAITDIYAEKKKRGLIGSRVVMDDATIEAEILDAVSSDRLIVLIDRLSVSKGKAGAKTTTSWEEIERSLSYYAGRFRMRLESDRAD